MCNDQEEADSACDDQEGQEASAEGSGNTTTALTVAHLISRGIVILVMYYSSCKMRNIFSDTTPAPAHPHPISRGIVILIMYVLLQAFDPCLWQGVTTCLAGCGPSARSEHWPNN